jgi:hypothetical protein
MTMPNSSGFSTGRARWWPARRFSSWNRTIAEVDVGEHVAGDHEEPLVELVHGVADRAGGAEGCLLGGVDGSDTPNSEPSPK